MYENLGVQLWWPAANILAAITDGQNVTVLMLVAVLWVESWSVDSAILICCHVTNCTCALLLSQHNAQILLACNDFHIMLSIIDSSLLTPSYYGSSNGNCWQKYMNCAISQPYSLIMHQFGLISAVWIPPVSIIGVYAVCI